MSGRRGARRATGVNVSDEQNEAAGGVQHSPPRIPIPPPIPNTPINAHVPGAAANIRADNPPPRYDHVNATGGIPNDNANYLPGFLRHMMENMQNNQQALVHAFNQFAVQMNARLEQPRQRQAPNIPNNIPQPPLAQQFHRPETILPPVPFVPFQPGRVYPQAAPGQVNVLGNQEVPNAHLRTQHLKTTDARIPQYSGASDTKTPYDFLIEMEKYKEIVRYTEAEMFQYVIPLALTMDAYNWYRCEVAFEGWEDFKRRLRADFQAIDYHEDMRRELHLRTQGPTEPLTEFIRVIRGYYERIGDPIAEVEIVSRILRNRHPEYKQALLGKRIATLDQLKREAHSAQELIKSMRTY
jgi:hypothetical protein